MDETRQSLKQKKIDKNNNDINKNNKNNIIKDNILFKCMFNCLLLCRSKRKSFISKCSIMKQFLFILVPLAHIISLILTYAHIFFSDKAFQNDYYSTIKKEYLRNLI
jgi:hypothetical protein